MSQALKRSITFIIQVSNLSSVQNKPIFDVLKSSSLFFYSCLIFNPVSIDFLKEIQHSTLSISTLVSSLTEVHSSSTFTSKYPWQGNGLSQGSPCLNCVLNISKQKNDRGCILVPIFYQYWDNSIQA